jgi:hypothetical protein
MRVLLSCLQALRPHDIPAYGFWRDYFIQGCGEAGIHAVEVPGVDWAEGLAQARGSAELKEWRARTWEKTLDFARGAHARHGLDFFLGYLYPQHVERSAVAELRRMGIPCVNFFCDNLREFRKVPDVYSVFDLHWVPEFEALAMYRRAGLKHIHAPMPCWIPERLRSVPEQETEPATFIGSADILRSGLLSDALAAGAELTVRGPGWSGPDRGPREGRSRKPGSLVGNQVALLRQHGLGALAAKIVNTALPVSARAISPERVQPAVFGEEYFRVTREARVTVGINRVPVARRPLRAPLAYSRLRDIEAPMLGACYLTEYSEGLAELYDLGKEVECYGSAAELAAKLEQLRKEPERRKQLRIAGQRKALGELSVKNTLGRIVTELGLQGSRQSLSP